MTKKKEARGPRYVTLESFLHLHFLFSLLLCCAFIDVIGQLKYLFLVEWTEIASVIHTIIIATVLPADMGAAYIFIEHIVKYMYVPCNCTCIRHTLD